MAGITGIGPNPVLPGKVVTKEDYDVLYNALTQAPSGTTPWGWKYRIAPVTVSTDGTTGTHTISLVGIVPTGTNAVTLHVEVTDATAGTGCRIRETGSSTNQWRADAQVANIMNSNTGDVALDSSYTFDINNSAAIDTLLIRLTAVYL